MLIVCVFRKGLPFKIFSQIKSFTPFSDSDWAEYLDLSSKTLQRNREEKDFSFKPNHTEQIFELSEVINFGIEVFGFSHKFYNWIKSALFALNNLKPLELINDSYGKEMVIAELNRIEHGIFA